VKHSRAGATPLDMRISFPGTVLNVQNATLGELLRVMNPGTRIEGGPVWVEEQRFDILAKANADEGPLDSAAQQQVMLALLQDRFKLAYHAQSKEVAGLALLGGKAPSRLRPSTTGTSRVHFGENGQILFEGIGMGELAKFLFTRLSVPVADRTGIVGRFDFALDPLAFADSGTSYPDRVRAAAEDLGFRFESQKAALSTVMIDHAELPGEN